MKTSRRAELTIWEVSHAKPVLILSLIASIAWTTSCTVYESPDRVYFNKNARAGAPTGTFTLDHEPNCEVHKNSFESSSLQVNQDSGIAELFVSRKIAGSSEDQRDSVGCAFIFTPDENSQDDLGSLISNAETHVETLAESLSASFSE